MFNLFGKRGEKVFAVADIGSGTAAIGIAHMRPDEPARVFAARRAILPLEERSEDATLKGIAEEVEKTGAQMLKEYAERAGKKARAFDSLYLIVRAPWSRSRTARASMKFESETTITSSMIGELAQKALAEEKDIDRNTLLEASVVRVELNGYPTGAPVGKKAHSLRTLALVSECNASARQYALQSVQKIFPQSEPAMRSSIRALLTVLRELPAPEDDYFIVDMGSEGTNLCAVRAGAPSEHAFISEGMKSILKRIAPSGMPEETLTLMRMLSRDQCSSAACEALQTSLAAAESELVRIFGEAMTQCAAHRRLPNRLVLVGHPDLLSWLTGFFSRIDFGQFTQTTRPFTIVTVSLPDLSRWVVPEHGVVPDAALSLGIALVNIEDRRGIRA